MQIHDRILTVTGFVTRWSVREQFSIDVELWRFDWFGGAEVADDGAVCREWCGSESQVKSIRGQGQ
ncbi:hypothetical protein HSR121_2903 [Halapricum desulfuricans]|uniref:Uncharacterized protein n=1 Tax=Halapricum desulfuricans TaxID=2841257 RepID=A0A897N405_9EURY|nr:hypothetical protein HSR121_2903 [Halapricum desulfuricans]